MDSNEEVTWITTRNTVKDRMIESSLIHQFTDSKKLLKSTQLLNRLIEKYRGFKRYQDYVKMKKLIKQKVYVDIEVEDDKSFEECDYSILHKMNFSCKNNVKKPKDTISNKQNSSITSSVPNEIISINIDLPKGNKKRVRTFQVNGKNNDEIPVKKIRLKNSSKQCLKNIEKIHPVINTKNSSNSFKTNNMNASLEASINHTRAVLDTEDNNSLAVNTRDEKQINNSTHKTEIMENTINEPSMQTNHLQLSHKYPMKEKIYQDLIDADKDEAIHHFGISNVNPIQEMETLSTNNIVQNIEKTSHDIKDVIIKKQDEVTCNSNITDDNLNLNEVTNEKSENDVCSPNSVVLQSQKSPPKVKSTEIINKKYKIINKENSYNESPTECYDNIKFLESSTPLSFPKCEEEEELQENEGYEDSINSSLLSQSEKRIRQLKMLNLNQEYTSSSSEDEILQQKDNLSETTVLNDSLSKTLKQNTTWSKLKLNRSHETHYKNNTSFHSLKNMNNSTNHQHNTCTKDLTKCKKHSSINIEPKAQTLCERPCNLENFIKKEELVQDTTAPLFSLPDFSKDEEIFLVDMPITVQLADLQGQRILLKKKLLKLGTNKYKILYNDIPAQSCVFSTCRDSEPYKMINIKPRSSITVKRTLFPLSVPKYSKHDTKLYHNVQKNK